MRLSLLVLSAVLPTLALAAKSSVPRIEKFRALAKKHGGIIPLTSTLYDELTEGSKSYSVSVLLTAMSPQYKCAPCVAFAPEHTLVAKSWAKQSRDGDEEHFFGVLDFQDGQAIFARMGLQSAPNLYLFRATEGRRSSANSGAEKYDFGRSGFKAEGLAAWLKGNADIPLKFVRPVDRTKLVITGAVLGFAILALITAWPLVKFILCQTHIWSSMTMITILLMTSGYMWNQIRTPAYMQMAQGGKVNYIAGGYSNQLGAETHIMSAVYGILAFSVYTLAYTIPKLQDPVRQRLGVYVWTGISVVMLGVLMNIFRMKQGGYPFGFF